MPFGTQRQSWSALIAGGAVGLLLAGCASTGSAPAAGADEGEASSPKQGGQLWVPWETVDSGRVGNAFTGVRGQRLQRPIAVASRDGVVYIVDAGRDLLLTYDTMSGRFDVFKELWGVAKGDPADVYVSKDRSVYLADPVGSRVLHFDRDGRLLRTFKDDLNLSQPVAVAVDEPTGDVYIADGALDYVLVYNSHGKLLRTVGQRGQGPGRFLNITGMTLGPDGVYIIDRLDERGEVLTRKGQPLYTFQPDTLVFPTSIVVDRQGRAFVSDFFDHTIKVFGDGELIATTGGAGAAPGHFKGLQDLWLEDGFLYAADSLNGRIQILRLTAEQEP